MKYFAPLILIGFLMMGFLGFMPINHSDHHMAVAESPCPIVAMFNLLCSTDAVSMAVIHIGALQSFLSFPISGFLILLLMLLAICLVPVAACKWPDTRPSEFLGRMRWERARVRFSPLNKERSWLSLFENSPSFA